MAARVTMNPAAVERIVEVKAAAGAQKAAKFMEAEMKRATSSRRLRDAVGSEAGRDSFGWYARAGMPKGTQRSSAFIWIFHEYQTGKGPPGAPFIRQALWSNTGLVGKMMLGRR